MEVELFTLALPSDVPDVAEIIGIPPPYGDREDGGNCILVLSSEDRIDTLSSKWIRLTAIAAANVDELTT
jgi:hypothetical protein